jgi:hypothetical protein
MGHVVKIKRLLAENSKAASPSFLISSIGMLLAAAIAIMFGIWGIVCLLCGAVAILWGIARSRSRQMRFARADCNVEMFEDSVGASPRSRVVARVVFERLSRWCGYPVMASDRIYEDLGIGHEDIEFEIADMAIDLGIDLAAMDAQEWWIGCLTARDLVVALAKLPISPCLPPREPSNSPSR